MSHKKRKGSLKKIQ